MSVRNVEKGAIPDVKVGIEDIENALVTLKLSRVKRISLLRLVEELYDADKRRKTEERVSRALERADQIDPAVMQLKMDLQHKQ